MSDPNREGPYACREDQAHGLMMSYDMPGLGVCAFLCLYCGCWRHALPASDPRRAQVEQAMPALIDALLVGARGEGQ